MSTFTLPDGKALYYEIHGDGEPIVMLHGCGRLRRLILCDCSPKIRSTDNWEYGVTDGYDAAHDLRKMDAEAFLHSSVHSSSTPSLSLPGKSRHCGSIRTYLRKQFAKF